MKNFIIERKMINSKDGYYTVVVEGETHSNRTVIKSDIQFFTKEGGYDYNHPEEDAKQNAQAIADGLNKLEKRKQDQNTRYPKNDDLEEKLKVIDEIIKLHPSFGVSNGWSCYTGGMKDSGEWNYIKMKVEPLDRLKDFLKEHISK